MGHNVNRTKKQDEERERRRAELQPFVVPGWQIDPATWRIVEVQTILGLHQRRQQVLLRCRRDDCHRRVALDLDAAVRVGLGDKSLQHLLYLLRCHHWHGCRLEETSITYPDGVPLVAYLQHDTALIAIACEGCASRSLLQPAEVIRRLKEAGRGDGATGILKLGEAVRGPCPRCGRRRFTCNVVWTGSVPAGV